MKTALLLPLFIGFAALVGAQERGQSIMFQDKPNDYEYLTSEPKEAGRDQGDQCMEMSRQIEQLKGKPQRRHALMQRYQLECQEPALDTIPEIE
jgi:hypothetical protein